MNSASVIILECLGKLLLVNFRSGYHGNHHEFEFYEGRINLNLSVAREDKCQPLARDLKISLDLFIYSYLGLFRSVVFLKYILFLNGFYV